MYAAPEDEYTIDAVNPNPDAAHTVPDEGNGPGVAAGYGDSTAAITGKKLIVNGVNYQGNAYGAYNKGSGDVTGNKLFIKSGAKIMENAGKGGEAYGGRATLGDASYHGRRGQRQPCDSREHHRE